MIIAPYNMYRTDKQFMKDPTTAHSRIYIGNIAETVVADNLEQKFKAHGKILGLVLQRGFGFIQYENEYQAKQAIAAEHGNMFYGKKLNVKQAYAQGPTPNAPNKQFPYQQPNNPNANFQYPPQHQNMEKPKELERDMNRPGPPYEQHHLQNHGPQPQNQMQHQQPLISPQKNLPPQAHNMQHPQPPQPLFPPSQQKGHPPFHMQQQQRQHLQNEMPIQGPHEPLMDGGDGGPPVDDEPPMGPMGSGGPPMRVNSPTFGGGGGPPGPPGGNGPDSKRLRKRRRAGGRDRELDRHGLPMDYR